MAYGDIGWQLVDLDQRARLKAAMTEIDESREDWICHMWLLGSSPRAIADHFGISIADVNATVDEKIVKLDNAYWVCAAALDLERLEEMQARFLRDALGGDVAASLLCLKIAEQGAASSAPKRQCESTRWN